MSLDHATRVRSLLNALLIDVRRELSDLVPMFAETFDRIGKLVETRGIRIVCIDLPSFGKALDKALSSGHLNYEAIPPSLGSIATGYLFQHVIESRIIDPITSRVLDSVDPTLIFYLRTCLYGFKKVVKETTDDVTSEAVHEFFQIDSRLRCPTYDWTSDWLNCPSAGQLSFANGLDRIGDQLELFPIGITSTRTARGLASLADRVFRAASTMLGTLDPNELIGRHGPGSVADLRKWNDKFIFPTWPKKLDYVFSMAHHAALNYDAFLLSGYKTLADHEPPALLHAVPKTMKSPRLITSEPTAYQFLQQGLRKHLLANLPRWLRIAIDFSSQEPSRVAALESSKTGDRCTIDLKSASDRLSLWTVERAFQHNPPLLRALHAVRSRWVVTSPKLCHSTEWNGTILRKYAGQGNATTFVVQSIVYACLCITATLWAEHGARARVTPSSLRRAARKVQVFGDDLILPSSAGPYLALLLELNQLEIGWDKTHHQGNFRESCGMDAYKGYDVTPLYFQSLSVPGIKPSAKELASWIDVSNNAYRKGLWALSYLMMESLPKRIRKKIPITRDPSIGLRFLTHGKALRFPSKQRFNVELQLKESHCLVVKSESVRQGRQNRDNILQYIIEGPEPETLWSSGYITKTRSLLESEWVRIS